MGSGDGSGLGSGKVGPVISLVRRKRAAKDGSTSPTFKSASLMYYRDLTNNLDFCMVRSHFATTTGWQRSCFCPPSQRRSGAGPSSPREKPNLHRQRECAVKCSCGSVLSGSPFSSVPYTVCSVARAHGHCLSNIAHLARCSVHWETVAVERSP